MGWSTRCSRTSLLAAIAAAMGASAQDLVPRAYLITPVGSNAVMLSSIFNNGKMVVDPSIPVEDGKGRFQTHVLSYYHAYSLLGRSSNLVVSFPYAFGDFEGVVAGVRAQASRSGLADARVRLSVNLRGGRAMRLKEYLAWREKSLIGASLTVVIPIGQYDPARVINTGRNRWGFKPEIGFSRRWGNWVAEGYGGAWLFTGNSKFYPGDSTRTQQPMGAVESHIGYYFKPRLWISLDVNFWAGGRSTINGFRKQDQQRNSRGGATASIPISRHQSLKFSYSRGTYVTVGGDFNTVSAAWQYSWLGKPN